MAMSFDAAATLMLVKWPHSSWIRSSTDAYPHTSGEFICQITI